VGATLPASTGGIDGSLSGQKNGDWFTGAAALSITKPDGVKVEVSVDGGPFGPAPDSITGDGVHTIDIRGSNGGTDSLIAPIDTTPPEIVIGTPANGGTYVLNSSVPADYTCRDSGSGVATPCTGTVPNGANIDTSSVGTKTFTVQGVTDAAGRSTPARTVTYTVGLRKIVFSSGRTGDGDIYTTTPDGSGLARLTTSPKIDEQPALSPDGTKIAFGSKRDDSNGKGTEIYVMDVDGQNVKRLTNAKDDDTAPAWSADGRKIAFQSKRDGNPEIYVMNADGTGQTRLTNNSKQDIEPTWSPNGQRIAFMSDRMGGPNIWVMDSTGANVTQLTFTKQPEGDPAWSPDGSLIAFGSKRSDANGTAFDIFTMKPDGSNVTRLTTAKSDDFEPAWSRDGLKIAFTAQRDGNPEVYVMNANGTGQTRVTTSGGFDRQPDW
jgi:dipeptidyl aminopeptidase/acylaminoacyl peptidase